MGQLPSNFALEKKLNRIAWAITAVVLALVFGMHRIHLETSIDFRFLPAVYSTLNAITALILVLGLYFIKTKQQRKHQLAMTAAVATSLLFLLGYVLYHITNADTKFGGEGTLLRTVYFTLLISHIVLAAVIFPFILFTFIRAFTKQFDRHKKMARWVYWVWLYVALSGPVLYCMIKPYYN